MSELVISIVRVMSIMPSSDVVEVTGVIGVVV
jgi:hypothetical protein